MVDTVKTRDQLITRALKNIGIIESGEAPSAEDYASVDDLIDPLIAQLSADGIVYIADPDEIELEFYLPLARILGNIAGPDFGSAINEDAKTRDENILRRIEATKPTFETVKAKYY